MVAVILQFNKPFLDIVNMKTRLVRVDIEWYTYVPYIIWMATHTWHFILWIKQYAAMHI